MEVSTAVALLENLVYKPGWIIEARDDTMRFESTVVVHITYPAHQFNRVDAADGYRLAIMADAYFHVRVGDCTDAVMLYRRLLQHIILDRIECHEAREALRVPPTFWAPFHPHRQDGMERWGDVEGDMGFGVV